MSENRISYVPALPTFSNGSPLSATSLNSFTANQEYLNQRMLQPVAAQDAWLVATNYTILHQMRYLYIKLKPQDPSFLCTLRVLVNGKRVAQQSFSSGVPEWSGVVDLNGNDLDGAALGLTYLSKYTVRWEIVSGTEQPVGLALFWIAEVATSDGSLALPVAAPSFADGQTVPDTKLNAISSDIGYLINLMDDSVNPGFQYRHTHIQAPSSALVHNYRMKHAHRYLVVRANLDLGYNPNEITFRVKWNENTLHEEAFTKSGTGGVPVEQISLYLDLSSYTPTVGTVYKVEINAQKTEWDDLTYLTMLWIGESPVNNLPAF